MGQNWDDVVSRESLRGSTVRPLELAGLDCNNYRSVFAESTPASHTALDIDPKWDNGKTESTTEECEVDRDTAKQCPSGVDGNEGKTINVNSQWT
ncbi:hypothetical protein PV325_004415 [Microctonus aethiopoides]|nr:hypothetical protein PV325_004415 [Microctonus aethiopoides]KAK0088622.1 hypothetical protein PV326_004779 [Microctonus aethiopoides]